jgi:hypothetical protein
MFSAFGLRVCFVIRHSDFVISPAPDGVLVPEVGLGAATFQPPTEDRHLACLGRRPSWLSITVHRKRERHYRVVAPPSHEGTQLKKWSRTKKIELIDRLNPRSMDIGDQVFGE